MEKVNKQLLWFEVACVEENKLWFVSGIGNGLFEFDLESNKTKFLGMIPEEEFCKRRSIGVIKKWNNELIMAPYNGNYFVRYNLETKKFSVKKCLVETEQKFSCGVVYKDSIYFLGCKYLGIAKYDISKDEIIYLESFKNQVLNEVQDVNDLYFRNSAYLKGDTWIIPSCQKNFLLEYNLKDNSYFLRKIGEEDFRFNTVICEGDNYWLMPRKQKVIVKYNYKTNKESYYPINQFSFTEINGLYSSDSVKTGRSILTFDLISENVGKVNCENNEMVLEKIQIAEKSNEDDVLKNQYITWINEYKNNIFIFSSKLMQLIEIDENVKIHKLYSITLSEDEEKKYYKAMINGRFNYIQENKSFCNLEKYIEEVSVEVPILQEREKVGKKIHDNILELLKEG